MPSQERVIGVDVGGTKVLAGLVDRDGNVETHREHPTELSSQAALLDQLVHVVEELRDERVAAVGFGLPSMIDRRNGVTVGSVNIPLAGVAFRAVMEQRLGLPVGIDNDATVATIAEWKSGAGRGADHLVMLTLGTGVGGGLILGGRPYRGTIGSGGELGHLVIEVDGALCGCGGRGHLEAYVSGSAADAAAREEFGPAVDAHRLVRLADEGEPRAIAILTSIGRRLGAGISTLINVFDPELVVVGGGFAAAGDHLLAPAREVVARDALSALRDRVEIVRAALGTAAGMVGAGMVGFEALEDAGVAVPIAGQERHAAADVAG